MFEKTFEAQALDAPSSHLSPYSIAFGIHMAAAIVLLAISFMIVPIPNIPDPPEPGLIFVRTFPVDEIREEPAPAAAPPRRRGVENPGPAVDRPPKPEPPETPPTQTPEDLPTTPTTAESDVMGDGEGPKGDPDGVDGGVDDGPTGPGGPGGKGDGQNVPIELTPEMVRPVLLHKVSPLYPDVARKARLEGRVTVQAVIGLDGSVESVEILRTTNPLFDAAALSAVRQWRYRPATMNGVPVRVYFIVEVGFVLR